MDVRSAFDIGRALSHGMDAVKRQPLGLLLGAFILILFGGGGGGGGGGGPSDYSGIDDRGARDLLMGLELGIILISVCVGCFCAVLGLFVRAWIQPGYYRMHRDLVVTGAAEVGTLFGGGDAFLRTLLWQLLMGVVLLGTVVAAAIPGGIGLIVVLRGGGEPALPVVIGLVAALSLPMALTGAYVGLGLALGGHAVALDGLGPAEALEKSWALASGNRIHLLLFFFVVGLFNIVGLLMCCLPIVWTKAVSDFGVTESYLLATGSVHGGDDLGSAPG